MIEAGNDRLRGTRRLWLYAMENLPKDKIALMHSLRQYKMACFLFGGEITARLRSVPFVILILRI